MKCARHLYGPATVNEKGQIVIPAEARKALGIEPNSKLMVLGNAKRKAIVLVPADVFEKKTQGLMGYFFSGDDS